MHHLLWAFVSQDGRGLCIQDGSRCCLTVQLVRGMRPAPSLTSLLASLPATLPQVGQKRGRSQLEELNAEVLDGSKRKKVRLGFPASQWVTVYNKHAPMKQR